MTKNVSIHMYYMYIVVTIIHTAKEMLDLMDVYAESGRLILSVSHIKMKMIQ